MTTTQWCPSPNNGCQRELANYRERFHIALKAAGICVFEVDLRRQLYTFFENAEDIFAVPGETILRDVRPFSALAPDDYREAAAAYFSHPDDSAEIARAFGLILAGQSTTYQARMRAGGSDYIWCKIDVSPILEGGVPVRMVGVITDISEIKRRTEQLEQQSMRDSFTGLYDKQNALRLIRGILSRSPQQTHALVLVDLDNFKHLNDTLGHAAGDVILKSFSRLLKREFRSTDIVGRFGGDEFVLLIQDIRNTQWLLTRLSSLLSDPECLYPYTLSAGAALFPKDADTFDALFACADQALYRAKQAKNTYRFFAPGAAGK